MLSQPPEYTQHIVIDYIVHYSTCSCSPMTRNCPPMLTPAIWDLGEGRSAARVHVETVGPGVQVSVEEITSWSSVSQSKVPPPLTMKTCTQNVTILWFNWQKYCNVHCVNAVKVLTLYSQSFHYGHSVHRRAWISQCWGLAVCPRSPGGYTHGHGFRSSSHQSGSRCLSSVLHTPPCKCNDNGLLLFVLDEASLQHKILNFGLF